MHRGFFSQVPQDSLNQTISKALDWIGWTDRVKRDSTVFVKPNFTWPMFRPGVVTSPRFLSELLPLLKDRAARVLIGESDLPIFRTSKAFLGIGIDRICQKNGVEMVELSRGASRIIETDVHGRKIRIRLPKLILDDVDAVVNAAVPKCHVVTGMSGAMKNFYGLIPDPFRGNKHRHEINRAIVAVNKIVPSDLIVIDGLYSLTGRGPIMGQPVSTNVIIAADNVVTADGIICRFFQMDPMRIKHLKLATREKLGSTQKDAVEMPGPMSATVRLRPKRATMDYFAVLTFKSRIVNRAIMSSPITPLLYKALKPFRSSREGEMYKEDIGSLPQSQFTRDKGN